MYKDYESGYHYRRYRKPGAARVRRWAIVFSVLAVILGVVIYFQRNVTQLLISLSEATVQSLAASAVNEAVYETLQWNAVDYEKLVTITRDAEQKVLSIEANAKQLNLLARQSMTLSMANLNEICEQGVRVPLGAFTGMEVIAGFGPKVKFEIIPVGTVRCAYRSSFTTAGINQTLHTIDLDVTATVSIVMPAHTAQIETVTEVFVCESLIVGEVPDLYLHGDIFENAGLL